MNQGSSQAWAVPLDNDSFVKHGLPWLYHARRYPGLSLYVLDITLAQGHKNKLTENGVTVLSNQVTTVIDLWALLFQGVAESSVLYSSPSDLINPVPILAKGSGGMVFKSMSKDSELFNITQPLVGLEERARVANYLEDKVIKKYNSLVSHDRICGPLYLWKAMLGLTRYMQQSRIYPGNSWEPLAVNLFAATYPEYTEIVD